MMPDEDLIERVLRVASPYTWGGRVELSADCRGGSGDMFGAERAALALLGLEVGPGRWIDHKVSVALVTAVTEEGRGYLAALVRREHARWKMAKALQSARDCGVNLTEDDLDGEADLGGEG